MSFVLSALAFIAGIALVFIGIVGISTVKPAKGEIVAAVSEQPVVSTVFPEYVYTSELSDKSRRVLLVDPLGREHLYTFIPHAYPQRIYGLKYLRDVDKDERVEPQGWGTEGVKSE